MGNKTNQFNFVVFELLFVYKQWLNGQWIIEKNCDIVTGEQKVVRQFYYAILYCQAHVYNHNNNIIQMKGAHLLKTVLTMAPDNVSLTR